MIKHIAVDDWTRRAAALLDGLDLTDADQRAAGAEVIAEATSETAVSALRRLAFNLGSGNPPTSREGVVAHLVGLWALRGHAEVPATTAEQRRVGAEDVMHLAGLYRDAVGSAGSERDALRRLVDAVAWLDEVMPR